MHRGDPIKREEETKYQCEKVRNRWNQVYEPTKLREW